LVPSTAYTLLWALIAAVTLKWFINREIGRFAVCTGSTIVDGFRRVPGPWNWAVWLILVPQLLVAVATIAALAASAATALVLVFLGDVWLWMIVTVLTSTALVLWGRYRGVETAAKILAVLLGLASVVAAVSVFPSLIPLVAGLIPSVPPDVNYGEILPWLGFMLSGAAGPMWYSYWI
jgi:Mn2+/Fe2+ NRAMP family transporter